MGEKRNRLAYEKTPYLLQHKNNPVEWHPWGQEAFDKARGERKPVFLSIAYSTCHWCHVMAHESFEDAEAIIRQLQKRFLPETALLYCPPGEPTARLKEIVPFLGQYRAVNGRATLYLCSDHACQAPVTGREEMQRMVESLSAA